VDLTWLFHPVRDIQQTPACAAVYSDRFPDGDRGGNLTHIRVRPHTTILHAWWNELLGTGATGATIGKGGGRSKGRSRGRPPA
jgi:hypothetical protein